MNSDFERPVDLFTSCLQKYSADAVFQLLSLINKITSQSET